MLIFDGVYAMEKLSIFLLCVLLLVLTWPLIAAFVFFWRLSGALKRSGFEPGHQVQAHDPAAIRGVGESPDALWRAANATGTWRTANTASALAGCTTRSAEYGR